jgi:hypothetical protein
MDGNRLCLTARKLRALCLLGICDACIIDNARRSMEVIVS